MFDLTQEPPTREVIERRTEEILKRITPTSLLSTSAGMTLMCVPLGVDVLLSPVLAPIAAIQAAPKEAFRLVKNIGQETDLKPYMYLNWLKNRQYQKEPNPVCAAYISKVKALGRHLTRGEAEMIDKYKRTNTLTMDSHT